MQVDAYGSARSLAAMGDLVRSVEGAGFEGMWIPEGGRPVFSMCSAAALAAEHLTIGTGVAVAFARSPMVTAQAAWMLAEATGGRFLPGLGTQVRAHVERRFSAPFEHPGPRMKEYVAALHAIFRAFRGEERLSFAGDFYTFSLLPPEWSPGPMEPPDPPIYLAGVRPWMCRMIGEVADGIFVHPLHSLPYIDDVVLPAIAAGTEHAGRPVGAVRVVCPVMTAVADDEQGRRDQREQLRARLAFYGSTPGYGIVFEASGWPDVADRLRELQRARDMAGLTAAITDEMVDAFAVTATWDELPRALFTRYRGRVDRLVCYSALEQSRSDPEALARWADVAAELRRLAAGDDDARTDERGAP